MDNSWSAQTAADAEIGVLLDGLRARGLWTSTVIAFSADNGPEELMVYATRPRSFIICRKLRTYFCMFRL